MGMNDDIAKRLKRIPPIIREALLKRIHEEIDKAEVLVTRLPAPMVSGPLKDDARLVELGWSARTKQRKKKTAKSSTDQRTSAGRSAEPKTKPKPALARKSTRGNKGRTL
jgi:hypothetical protein